MSELTFVELDILLHDVRLLPDDKRYGAVEQIDVDGELTLPFDRALAIRLANLS